jgi:hypothetical protein
MHFILSTTSKQNKKIYNTDRNKQADASCASISKLLLALEPDLSTTFNI